MFKGGGDAGGGKRGKKSLEYVKPTPKFLAQLREDVVKKENEQIQAITTLKKNRPDRDKEYDIENATVANEEKLLMIQQKKNENEINLQGLKKDFRPTFLSKSQKNKEKNEDDDERKGKEIEKKQEKEEKAENSGKRKALTDYIEDYMKQGDDKIEKKKEITHFKSKKVKTNLLSFEK